MNKLDEYLRTIHPLPGASLAIMEKAFQQAEFKRKEIITYEGQKEKYLYFVLEGIQRSYYIKEGKEHVIAFTYPPSFSGIPESFIAQTPSRYFLEAITESKMLRISHEKLQALMDEDREIERLMRKATELVLIGLVHRHYELLAYSIEDRFKAFASRSAHLFNLIPHKYLASYLGINATNFSKLLSKVKI